MKSNIFFATVLSFMLFCVNLTGTTNPLDTPWQKLIEQLKKANTDQKIILQLKVVKKSLDQTWENNWKNEPNLQKAFCKLIEEWENYFKNKKSQNKFAKAITSFCEAKRKTSKKTKNIVSPQVKDILYKITGFVQSNQSWQARRIIELAKRKLDKAKTLAQEKRHKKTEQIRKNYYQERKRISTESAGFTQEQLYKARKKAKNDYDKKLDGLESIIPEAISTATNEYAETVIEANKRSQNAKLQINSVQFLFASIAPF